MIKYKPALRYVLPVVLLLLALIPFWLNPPFKAAAEDVKGYALINNEAYLYQKSETDGTAVYTALFELPVSYFVALSENPDLAGEYVSASYLDVFGYIKKSEAEIVDYEPVTKFHSASLKASSPDGNNLTLRKKPVNDRDSIIYSVNDDEELFYYGTISGEEFISGFPASKTWYYVKKESAESTAYGYINSVYAADISEIQENKIEKVVTPVPPGGNPESPLDNNNIVLNALLITALSLPAVLIMGALFFGSRKSAKKKRPRGWE